MHFKTFTLGLCFFFCTHLLAQTPTGTANLKADFSIELIGSTLHSSYAIDLSHLSFRAESDLKWLSWNMTNNLISFTYDWANEVWILTIHNSRIDDGKRTVADWNSYLANLKAIIEHKYQESITISYTY